MVVCDGAYRDPYTGKYQLIGIFQAIGGREFPLLHPILTVYISLTDGRGKISLRLQLIDAEEEREPIFKLNKDIQLDDPRTIAEMLFQVSGIQFPSPGEYRLQLFAGREFILERRILVVSPPDVEEHNA
jgi:hypothetical protein